jgi:hypothetical protein
MAALSQQDSKADELKLHAEDLQQVISHFSSNRPTHSDFASKDCFYYGFCFVLTEMLRVGSSHH